jgi:drug/metabolite transporter (DMT)-like permease
MRASIAAPGQRPLLGIGLVFAMAACFAVLDTSAKRLGIALPVVVVLWSRYAFQALAMTVWLLRPGQRHLLRAAHPRFQVVRGLLLLVVSGLGFVGLQHMPVAEFTAVVMLTPVLVTVLAVLVLHERLTPLRWALVGGGFAGALIVVRPGSGLFGWAALIPAAGALCYAVFQLLTRQMAGIEHPLTTHLYTGLIGAAVASIALAALPDVLWPELVWAGPKLWALLLLVGVMGTVGHLLLIHALPLAPMSLLMPFTYVQIVFATVTGWLAFHHVPDAWAFAGMAVIAACGAAAVWLNARESARVPVPASTVNADTIGD